eukprot:gene3132-13839_t
MTVHSEDGETTTRITKRYSEAFTTFNLSSVDDLNPHGGEDSDYEEGEDEEMRMLTQPNPVLFLYHKMHVVLKQIRPFLSQSMFGTFVKHQAGEGLNQ